MTPRDRLAALLGGRPVDRLLIDVGTSTLTAPRPPAILDPARPCADPVMHLPVLTEAELAALGADTLRCGPAFPAARFSEEDDAFLDRDGVSWIWAHGEPAPLDHPLTGAGLQAIAAHRRRPLPAILAPQMLGDPCRAKVVIADDPSPGLLDTAFRLRGYYELMEDTVDQWPLANALFDRACDHIIDDYETLLRALPAAPDLVVYGDDLAYQTDLYLSEERFAFFLRPRLTRILSLIRARTDAQILFHSCGAALPVLKQVVALGVRLVNFQPSAAGMAVGAVRQALGPDVIFHGVLDFSAIADALERQDEPALAGVLDTIAQGWPMIAAPEDNLPASLSPQRIRTVTRFLEAIDLEALLAGHRTLPRAEAFAG